jgi:hypothetical protein
MTSAASSRSARRSSSRAVRETEALQRVLAALGGVPVPEHGASAPNGGDGIVAALRAGAYTATAVAEHAGVTPARACDTLGRLKAAGAVRRTGAGRGTHYRLVGDGRRARARP